MAPARICITVVKIKASSVTAAMISSSVKPLALDRCLKITFGVYGWFESALRNARDARQA